MRVYDEAELAGLLPPRWSLAGGTIPTIRRTFRTAGWRATLMVVNAIGHLAEAAWHHPELLVGYATVEVRLSTHDANGITDRDLELARRIEDVVAWQPSGGALTGPPADAPYVRAD